MFQMRRFLGRIKEQLGLTLLQLILAGLVVVLVLVVLFRVIG